MTPAALDLITRTVAEELARSRCPDCDAPLDGARFSVRPLPETGVAVRIACPACGKRVMALVEPGSEAGVARLR